MAYVPPYKRDSTTKTYDTVYKPPYVREAALNSPAPSTNFNQFDRSGQTFQANVVPKSYQEPANPVTFNPSLKSYESITNNIPSVPEQPSILDKNINNAKKLATGFVQNVAVPLELGKYDIVKNATNAVRLGVTNAPNEWPYKLQQAILPDKYDNLINKANSLASKALTKGVEGIEKIQEPLNQASSQNVVSNAVRSLPNTGAGLGLSLVNPALGAAYMYGTSLGAYGREAELSGASLDDQLKYANLGAGAETITEIPVFGSIAKVLKATPAKQAVTGLLKSAFKNAGKEALQESLTEVAITGAKKITYDPDAQLSAKAIIESGVSGAFAALMLLGLSSGVNQTVNVTKQMVQTGNIDTASLTKAIETEYQKPIAEIIGEEQSIVAPQATNNVPNLTTEPVLEQTQGNVQAMQQEPAKTPLTQTIVPLENQQEANTQGVGLTDKLNSIYQKYSVADAVKSKIDSIVSSVKSIEDLGQAIDSLEEIKTGNEFIPLKMNLQMFAELEDAIISEVEKLTNGKYKTVQEFPDTVNKVAETTKDKKSFPQRFEEFYTRTVDINTPIKKVGENPFVLATNSKKVGGTVSNIIDDALVDKKGDRVGDSWAKVVKSIPSDKQGDFWDYMLHKHNVDRMRERKPVYPNYTSEMSKLKADDILAKNPEFSGYEKSVNEFMTTFMQKWGVETGLVSQETFNSLKEKYPNYIPTYRIFEAIEKKNNINGKSGFVNQRSTLKKATGSKRDIVNPVQSVMELVNRSVRTARYNEVGQSLLDAIKKNPDKMQPLAELAKPNVVAQIAEESTQTPGQIDLSQLEGFEDLGNKDVAYKFIKKMPNGDDIVTVYDKGQQVYIKINDKPLLDALTSLHKSNVGDIEKVFKKITNGFKSLITQKNPIFAVRNIIRDIPTGYVNSSENNPVKYGIDLLSGIGDMALNKPTYQKYKGLGGTSQNFLSTENIEKKAKSLTKDTPLPLKPIKAATKGIGAAINATETMSRYAEFKRVLKRTGNEQKALYDSGEVTTNFSRGGDITKTVDSFVPYLNAAVQGLDKTARQAIKHPVAMTIKGLTGLTVPTIALLLINSDDEEYWNTESTVRDSNYLIPRGDGTFIRIPKSREYGVLFGSLFERLYAQVAGKNDAFKGFGKTLENNFAPTNPIESNILSPLLNLKANKDYADRPIVPLGMQLSGISPRYQYDERTSEISKLIGDKLNLSPKQINYLIDAYTGIVGDILLPATTKGGSPSKIFTTAFITDPLYSNQMLNDFYEKKDKIQQLAADRNFKENIDSKVVTKEEGIRNRVNKYSDAISDKYADIKLIEYSTELSRSEKDNQIKDIRAEIISLAKESNELYNYLIELPEEDVSSWLDYNKFDKED